MYTWSTALASFSWHKASSLKNSASRTCKARAAVSVSSHIFWQIGAEINAKWHVQATQDLMGLLIRALREEPSS